MQDGLPDNIHETFTAVASSLGYSEVHGRIISSLLVSGRPLSMDELAKATGYSPASISLSLDLLELIGIIKKFKQRGDRRLFVKLEGDLLEGLRNAMLLKLQKEISKTLNEFEVYKNSADEKSKRTVKTLEREVRRLQEYVNRLARVPLPKK
jgi:DNA-binding transcriptional regulator GbsR (MarR family)